MCPDKAEWINRFLQSATILDVEGDCACPAASFYALRSGVQPGLARRLAPVTAQVGDTLTIWISTTQRCNLECAYCYISKSPSDMPASVGLQAIDAAFRSASRHGFRKVKIKYAGGEPTLNLPLVLLLHQRAQKLATQLVLDLDEVVLNNGVGLTDQKIMLMRQNNLRLSISLDGLGEYHDVQRRMSSTCGSFSAVERSLDRLIALDWRPTITVTLTHRNLYGLPQLVKYLLDRRLVFALNFYRSNPVAKDASSLEFGEDEIIKAMRDAFNVIEADLPSYSLLSLLTDRARLDFPHERPCGVGKNYFAVNVDGSITRCHMEPEHSVTTVQAVDPLQRVRMDVSGLKNPSVREKEECRVCEYRFVCAGGCPLQARRMTGSEYGRSPNCSIYRALFPEVLRLEKLRLEKRVDPIKLVSG